MVRGSLKMELIKNEKARNSSFQRRKPSMKKKFDELTTLCDVRGAMVVHGANNKTELWVANNGQVKVRHMFHKYRNPTRENCEKRTVNLSRYYQERKRKAGSELEKLRKSNAAAAAEDMWKIIGLLDNEIAAAKASKDNLVTTNRNHTQPEKCYPQPLAVIYPQEPLVCYLPPPIAAVYPQEPLACYPRPIASIYPQQQQPMQQQQQPMQQQQQQQPIQQQQPPMQQQQQPMQQQQPPIQQQQPRMQQQPMQQQHGVGASFGANLTPNSGAVVLWNNNGFAGACGSNVVYAPLNSVPVYYVPMQSGMVTRSMRASAMCYYYGGQAVQLPPPPPPMQQYYLQYPRRMTRAAAAAAASSNVRASQI